MLKMRRALLHVPRLLRRETPPAYRGLDLPGVNIRFSKDAEGFDLDRKALTNAIAESVRSGRASAALRGNGSS